MGETKQGEPGSVQGLTEIAKSGLASSPQTLLVDRVSQAYRRMTVVEMVYSFSYTMNSLDCFKNCNLNAISSLLSKPSTSLDQKSQIISQSGTSLKSRDSMG